MNFIKFCFPKSRREVGYHSSKVILLAVKWRRFETVMQNIFRGRVKKGAGSGGQMRPPMSPPSSQLFSIVPTAPNHFYCALLNLPDLLMKNSNGLTAKS
jgi:hypothetical protein